MYVIKHKAEDFFVREVIDLESLRDDVGEYSLFLLRKRYIDTISAISKISASFKIDRKYIGYCGIKDKKAVTEQYITLPSFIKNKNSLFEISSDIKLEYLFNTSKKLNIGNNLGNYFEIVIRNLDEAFNDIALKSKDFLRVPNYFGDQRFSTNNVQIGRNIIKKDLKGALDQIREDASHAENISLHLNKNPNDLIGALKKVPKEILIFYIHSYQSFIWNAVIKSIIDGNIMSSQRDVPIIGFSSELDGHIKEIYMKILAQEGINLRDFIIREIPFLSMEGSSRNIFMDVADIDYYIDIDDEFKNKKKCLLKFKLGKGSYATELIKFIFEN